MTPYQRIMSVIVALLFFGLVVILVRGYRLSERQALFWLITSVVLASLAGWEDTLVWVAKLIGAEVPISGLVFWGIMTLLVLALLQSVKLHELHKRSLRLLQEVSLLKADIARLSKQTDDTGGTEQ